MAVRQVLLAGGGHSHLEVLRRYAASPDPALAATLVSPNPVATYSGMLPGVVAGHYAPAEAEIALSPLASAGRTRFLAGAIAGIDLDRKIAHLDCGRMIPFDILSLDVGALPDASIEGALSNGIGVRPFDRFLRRWEALVADAQRGVVRRVAVIGGGAGGVELLLAMHHRLTQVLGPAAPRFALFTDQPALLPQHAPAVRRRLLHLLAGRGVELHFDSPVVAIEPDAVVTMAGARIAADRMVIATSAAAAPWLPQSGLGCDAGGFVSVNGCLQSVTHPFVFAAGDCASQSGRAYPKSGLYAVRHGPTLAENLRRYARGAAMLPFKPPLRALALITTGGRSAVLSYGPLMASGRWVWRWKDRIDRRHIEKYRTQ